MTTVADASPLIFLCKVGRLALIRDLLGAEILVPDAVRDEVLAPPIDPVEKAELERFLSGVRIEIVDRPRPFATGASRADNAALTLAVSMKAAVLLADDRLIRRIAMVEGIRPLGTLGVLLQAMRKGSLDRQHVRQIVDELVGSHRFRIGIELYAAVLREIDTHPP